MTVSSTILRNDYTGNGSQTVFPFTFQVLEEGSNYSIKVVVTDTNGVETTKVFNTDYTVTLNADGTGSVTFTTAPTLDHKVTLLSNISKTQETDYISLGTDKFPADSHEKALDKLTLITQELEEKNARAILLPESSTLTDLTIPVSAANADKAIVVNSTGDNLDAKNLADIGLAPVTDYAKTLLDDTTASEAQSTLGISTYAKTLLDDTDAATARATLDAEQKINSLTAITALEDADQLAVSDSSDSNNSKKITYANLKSDLSSIVSNPNLIINGDFRIYQRTGFATLSHVAPAPIQYNPDRWAFEAAGSGFSIDTIASTNLPTGSLNGRPFRIETTAAKASLATGDFLNVRYRVEGYDYAKIHGGNFTVSFFARTNKAGIYGVSFFNSAHNRIYTTEIEVTSSDATSENWVKYTITISADSSGTWLFENNIGLQISLTYASGSGAQTSTLDQWQNDTGAILTSNNQANLLDSVSNYFEIYRVKLEKGSTATAFVSRPIQEEIVLCQRHYEKSYDIDTAIGTITQNGKIMQSLGSNSIGLNTRYGSVEFKVTKRTSPTVTVYGLGGNAGRVSNASASDLAANTGNVEGAGCNGFSVISGASSTTTGLIVQYHYIADAEL